MKGFRKILIAVNGSKEVLEMGLKIAKEEDCWVTAIKVIPPWEGDLHLTGIKNIEDVIESNALCFSAQAKTIADSERILLKTRIERGDISKKILEVAQEENCDLIILGSRKNKSFFRKLFGDRVIEKVIQESPCPVLVITSPSSF